jgi:DNA-binding IclR family transcriptional regulator
MRWNGEPVRDAGTQDDRTSATAAEKVLHVLGAFERRTRWALGDLAGELGLPKSTVHRLLATLKSTGFVQQDPRDGAYQVGMRIWGLAKRAKDFDALAHTATPTLQALVAETGETAFISVRDGFHSLCVARVNTPQGVRLLIDVGTASPLHLGASNTVLLAFLPEAERSLVIAQTVLQPDERRGVEAEMRAIAQDGYAYSSEQLTPGAAALGVPIFDVDGRVLAALSIGAPAYRFERERALAMLPALRRAAAALTRRFGQAHPVAT